jgi:CDP-6-deoxy-D-xylo-4-hexulose-3-dehydrase
MVWTGYVMRQPAFKGIAHRVPAAGLPNADRVMEHGLVLPSNHALTDDDVDYIWETASAFLTGRRGA